jgi:hypothetical protein
VLNWKCCCRSRSAKKIHSMPEEMQKQIIKEESNGRRQAMEEIHTQN